MERVAYLVRRLLLVIPTFIGITIVCFALTRFLPGGPVEMRLMRMKGLGGAAAASGGGAVAGRNQVTEEYKKQLESQFGFDKPIVRCHDTALQLLEVKPEGSSLMTGGAFLSGRPLKPFEDFL